MISSPPPHLRVAAATAWTASRGGAGVGILLLKPFRRLLVIISQGDDAQVTHMGRETFE